MKTRLLLILFILTPALLSSTCKGRTPADEKPPANINREESFRTGLGLYEQKKYTEAFPFLEKAALAGHDGAQMRLGKMYFNGWGAPHSHEKARDWHEKAAAQGNRESIEKLKKFRH